MRHSGYRYACLEKADDAKDDIQRLTDFSFTALLKSDDLVGFNTIYDAWCRQVNDVFDIEANSFNKQVVLHKNFSEIISFLEDVATRNVSQRFIYRFNQIKSAHEQWAINLARVEPIAMQAEDAVFKLAEAFTSRKVEFYGVRDIHYLNEISETITDGAVEIVTGDEHKGVELIELGIECFSDVKCEDDLKALFNDLDTQLMFYKMSLS